MELRLVARAIASLALTIGILATPGDANAAFALRDNDRVVFLGDSNTSAILGQRGREEQGYYEIVESYTLLRFPSLRVEFLNRGLAGATARIMLQHLDRYAIDEGATAAIVLLGFNDLMSNPDNGSPNGWPSDPAERNRRKQIHLTALTEIVQRLVGAGIRTYVCTYPMQSVNTGIFTGTADFQNFIQQMGDEQRAVAAANGATGIDLTRPTRQLTSAAVQAGRDLSGADGIHLNKLGHFAAAWALLKGLGAPDGVSSVQISISGSTPSVTSSSGATVSQLSWNATTKNLRFVRQDQGLPYNVPLYEEQANGMTSIVPFVQDVARYTLTVQGLPPAGIYGYKLVVDGRFVALAAPAGWASGQNLTAKRPGYIWDPMPGGPWDVQWQTVAWFVRSRLLTKEGLDEFYRFLPKRDPVEFPTSTNLQFESVIVGADASLNRAQREIAKPTAYEFVVSPYP